MLSQTLLFLIGALNSKNFLYLALATRSYKHFLLKLLIVACQLCLYNPLYSAEQFCLVLNNTSSQIYLNISQLYLIEYTNCLYIILVLSYILLSFHDVQCFIKQFEQSSTFVLRPYLSLCLCVCAFTLQFISVLRVLSHSLSLCLLLFHKRVIYLSCFWLNMRILIDLFHYRQGNKL